MDVRAKRIFSDTNITIANARNNKVIIAGLIFFLLHVNFSYNHIVACLNTKEHLLLIWVSMKINYTRDFDNDIIV